MHKGREGRETMKETMAEQKIQEGSVISLTTPLT